MFDIWKVFIMYLIGSGLMKGVRDMGIFVLREVRVRGLFSNVLCCLGAWDRTRSSTNGKVRLIELRVSEHLLYSSLLLVLIRFGCI